jgi:hypothetical protein
MAQELAIHAECQEHGRQRRQQPDREVDLRPIVLTVNSLCHIGNRMIPEACAIMQRREVPGGTAITTIPRTCAHLAVVQDCAGCTCRCTMRMWVVEEARHDERTCEFESDNGGRDDNNDNGTCLEADLICGAGG